jgi:A/G-specific adenine glycosylase
MRGSEQALNPMGKALCLAVMTTKPQRSIPASAPKTTAHPPHPIAVRLLAWYDAHQRALPWRATDDSLANPYHVWLSEIMLQQTTVTAVKPYYEKFLLLFPTVGALAQADPQEVMRAWAGLGYYSRARNLHACAQQVVRDYQGQFPDHYDGLKALPGIGDYTAAAILSIAFGKRALVMDGNVERVVSRLYRVETELPRAKTEIRAHLDVITPEKRCGDFAQSMMDLGATLCTPRKPACSLCPLQQDCLSAHQADVETFPRKAAKKERPRRLGQAFVVLRDDGSLLMRTRPPKGLLGGMSEVPNSDWTPEPAAFVAQDLLPFKATWQRCPDPVRHVFTHFELNLEIYVATLPARHKAPDGMRFVALEALAQEALPSVMQKVVNAGLVALGVRVQTPIKDTKTKSASIKKSAGQ